MTEDYIARAIDLLKFDTVFNLIISADEAPDELLPMRDFLRTLVRNGCPFDAIVKTLEEMRKEKAE